LRQAWVIIITKVKAAYLQSTSMAMEQKIFKQCPMCDTIWSKRSHFLQDTSLKIEGYQVNFDDLGKGLLYFTHSLDGCQSTMAVEAYEFFDLNPNMRYTTRNALKDDCPGYCLRKDFLGQCTAECDCAFVRDVIAIIQKKKANASN